MLIAFFKEARKRSGRQQGGFTLVELLVVIAILGVLAAIVLFNISGVNANAACNAMKTDGATIQAAADLYWNSYGVYPVGTTTTWASVPNTNPASTPPGLDVDTPASGAVINQQELLVANLLHSATAGWNAPAAGQENFTYKAAPPKGSVHGAIVGNASCTFN